MEPPARRETELMARPPLCSKSRPNENMQMACTPLQLQKLLFLYFPGKEQMHENNSFQAVSKALVNELSFLHWNTIDATTGAHISLENRGTER